MKLFKFLKPYAWLIIFLIILTYLQVMANLKLPDYMATIVNEGIVGENMSSLYENGLWMLVVTFAGGVVAVIAGFLATKVATGFARDVRRATFERVESFSVMEFNKFSTASLITRTTNDVQQLQRTSFMILRMVSMALFMAIGALQNAIRNAPGLSWIIAVTMVGMVVMIATLFILAVPKFKVLQQLVDKLNLVTRENLTGLRVVRAFNKEKVEEQKFDETNRDLLKLNLYVNRLMVVMQPYMMLLMNLALVATVWFGAKLVSKEMVEIGNMMAFMQYAMQAIMSFLMISAIFILIPRAAVSSKRISEVL